MRPPALFTSRGLAPGDAQPGFPGSRAGFQAGLEANVLAMSVDGTWLLPLLLLEELVDATPDSWKGAGVQFAGLCLTATGARKAPAPGLQAG